MVAPDNRLGVVDLDDDSLGEDSILPVPSSGEFAALDFLDCLLFGDFLPESGGADPGFHMVD